MPPPPTPPPITLRRLAPTDSLETLTSLLHRAYAPQVQMGLKPLAGRQSVEQTRERAYSGECFVATMPAPAHKDAERLVGTILFQEVETASFPPFFLLPGVAHFSLLAVDPDIQGAGIGGKLIDAVETRARELGMLELALSMAAPDVGLMKFYEKRGFRHVEPWQWPYTNYVSAIMSRPIEAPGKRVSRLSECLIRPARDDDAQGLINLIGDIWSEYPGCVLDLEVEEHDLLAIATAFTKKDGAFWVAQDPAGKIVGSSGVVPLSSPGRFELKKLYVARSHRATGLGTRLLGWAECETRRRGGSVLELWTDTRFLDGHRFYEKHRYIKGSLTRALNDLSHTIEYHYSKRL
ncbi:MAG: GNAT family N-acetyltransferase [Phycisphaerales bacterium]